MKKMLFLLSVMSCCFAGEEEKIFFLHIPKSGGVTIRSILQDHYPLEQEYAAHDTNPDALSTLSSKCSLIYGHVHYFDVSKNVKDFKKMTFLRDPVERVLSEQSYILQRYQGERQVKERKRHFLPEQGDPIDTATNIACRMLSQLDPRDPAISDAQHLESAKKALDEFDFVGIVEQMNESMHLLHEWRGWKESNWIPKHNNTPRNTTYSPEVLKEIAKRNWADIALYEYGLQKFQEQKEKISCMVEQECASVKEIDYTFDQPLDGWGWCPREWKSNSVLRWLCSPEEGHIFFPLQADQDYVVKLSLYMPKKLRKQLHIKINGNSLDWKLKSEDGRWVEIEGKVPRAWIKGGEETDLEISIKDPEWKPQADPYRGRCGANRIRFIPKQSEESGIWQEGSSEFAFGARDHC